MSDPQIADETKRKLDQAIALLQWVLLHPEMEKWFLDEIRKWLEENAR